MVILGHVEFPVEEEVEVEDDLLVHVRPNLTRSCFDELPVELMSSHPLVWW